MVMLTVLIGWAHAGAASVEVRVIDSAGEVIPGAYVMERSEQAKHIVRTDTGRWSTTAFYLLNGDERIVKKGDRHALIVASPGYATRDVEVLQDRRKTRVDVVLQSQTLVASAEALPVEREAVEAFALWSEAYRAWIERPVPARAAPLKNARELAQVRIRDWLDVTDAPEAREACLHVGSPAFCGV